MYRIADGIQLDNLRKYGFRTARELPDFERWCDNDYWYNDLWLIAMDPDNEGSPNYIDEDTDILLWYIHIMPVNYGWRLWFSMAPACTYHIDNLDCEPAFYALFDMIRDGVIVDDMEVD